MANASISQDNQRNSMLSQKFEDEKVGLNVIMSASDEDLVRLGVRTIGDRVRD